MPENPSDEVDEQPVPDPDPDATAKADEDDTGDHRRHRNAEGLEVSTEDT